MTSRNHEAIPQRCQSASDPHLSWSYERLAEVRQAAARLRDSNFPWIHEQTHLAEIIDRIDATVRLKRERDQYQASRIKRGA
jgi:hypothetical protein